MTLSGSFARAQQEYDNAAPPESKGECEECGEPIEECECGAYAYCSLCGSYQCYCDEAYEAWKEARS
jgi:hypothetical protein